MLIIRSLSITYSNGHEIDPHAHKWGQLVYAASGSIHITTADATWLVPPARAVWLPPLTQHVLTMRGTSSLKTLYLTPERCVALPEKCAGLEVSPLLRELLLYIAALGLIDSDYPNQAKIADMLQVLLLEASTLPLVLRLPQDMRARRAAEIILRDPGAELLLSVLANQVGASVRTLQRLFFKDTGIHIGEWRQTARLLAASAELLEGASVTQAALASGYASTSAFISAFHRRTGRTPLEYRTYIQK